MCGSPDDDERYLTIMKEIRKERRMGKYHEVLFLSELDYEIVRTLLL